MTNAQGLLQNVYVFKDLNAKELDLISAISKVNSFNSGDEVFTFTLGR